ncbi:MAG TPA: hypothetical protein VKE69_03165 [Planctomycetota bacterium]|nr:hypothetical protein [Planctomycetota bacterium]
MAANRLAPLFLCLFGATAFGQASQPAKDSAARKDPAAAKAVLEKAHAANSKKSMKADFEMNANFMGMSMKGTGKIAVAHDGKMRQDMSMEMPMLSTPMKMVVVNDGKTFWIEQDSPMGKMVIKSSVGEMEDMGKKMGGGPMGGGSSQDPGAQLDQLEKMVVFDSVEDTEVDGKKAVAISGDFSKEAMEKMGKDNPQAMMMQSMMSRARVLFTVPDYGMSGFDMLNKEGQKALSMRYKNIDPNPTFDESLFAYTPPAGVKVMSMADMMRGGMMGGAEEEEEEEDDAPSPPASKPAGGK